MRQRLEHLSNKVQWIDTDNLYQAVSDIKEVLQTIVEELDKALPLDVPHD